MNKTLTDELLVGEIQNGNISLFGKLLDRYSQCLLAYIIHLTRDSHEAEDVLQEVFIRVYGSLKKFNINKQFKPWIYKITTNLCYDYLRKKKQPVSLDKNYSGKTNNESPLLETVPDKNYQPEDDFLDKELLAALHKEIDNLPDKQKQAFTLYHYDGFSYKEIAETLSIPMSTVKTRLYKAYQRVYFNMKKENQLWAIKIIVLFINCF